MLIRDLTAADLVAATAINNDNVPAVGESAVEDLTHIFGQCSIALGAEVEGELVGFCLVLPPGVDYGSMNYAWFGARYERFAYLDRVAIAAPYQNRGLGAAMYAEVEVRLTGTTPWFTLEVNLRPRNDGSLRFHARQGFTEVGQLETDYGALVSLLAKPVP